jgi:hypothetical protein
VVSGQVPWRAAEPWRAGKGRWSNTANPKPDGATRGFRARNGANRHEPGRVFRLAPPGTQYLRPVTRAPSSLGLGLNLKRRTPMKKKPPDLRLSKPKAAFQGDGRSWHNGGDIEIGLYARSLHKVAKTLIATLNLEPNSKTAWDACPVIPLYRQSVELHLKALVGEGSNFLPSRTDPITLYKTHSLRWLAQIVCQIIKAVRWENEFKCEGIATLADFTAVVNELEALDPVSIAVQSGSRARDGSVPHQLQPPKVVQFAKNLDCLLDLLDSTADALAAEWDMCSEGPTEGNGDGGGFEPVIH